MTITEIAWFPFRPDTQGSEDAVALDKLAPELQAQPGLISAWQGAPLERPQSGEFVNGTSPSLPYSPTYLTRLTYSPLPTLPT